MPLILFLNFYFRATLGVKEVLQSSKFSTSLHELRCFTYVTGTSRTSPGEPPMHRGMKKTVCGGLACYSKLLSLEVATVLESC